MHWKKMFNDIYKLFSIYIFKLYGKLKLNCNFDHI